MEIFWTGYVMGFLLTMVIIVGLGRTKSYNRYTLLFVALLMSLVWPLTWLGSIIGAAFNSKDPKM